MWRMYSMTLQIICMYLHWHFPRQTIISGKTHCWIRQLTDQYFRSGRTKIRWKFGPPGSKFSVPKFRWHTLFPRSGDVIHPQLRLEGLGTRLYKSIYSVGMTAYWKNKVSSVSKRTAGRCSKATYIYTRMHAYKNDILGNAHGHVYIACSRDTGQEVCIQYNSRYAKLNFRMHIYRTRMVHVVWALKIGSR